ncbi:MAG: hypothetical protein V1649_01270 [Patescibacteria group bacterium]
MYLPNTWIGYSAIHRQINWGVPINTTDSLDFGFPAQDSIFNISIFTKNQWNNLQSMEGPKPSYLGENSQYVFAYDISQFATNDEMVQRRSEILSIVSTFRLP